MSVEIGVLVDVIGIAHPLSYRVSRELVDELAASNLTELPVGTIVEVPLGSRTVRGWVVDEVPDAASYQAPEGELSLGGARELSSVKRVVGPGPPAAVVELAKWAASSWLGAPQHFLRTASAARPLGVPLVVPPDVAGSSQAVGVDARKRLAGLGVDDVELATLAAQAAASEPVVALRVGPCGDLWAVVGGALTAGQTLVVAPTLALARQLAARARAARVRVAVGDDDWHRARSAQLVVGARSAVWAPMPSVSAVVVLDEHSSLHQGQKTPAWNARDVAVERARRQGASCLLVSPAHSPAALRVAASVVGTSPLAEKRAWSRLEVIDRREDDPTAGEWCSPRLARLLGDEASARQVTLVVLNRTGRYRLAICASCGEVARSTSTDRALAIDDGEFLDPSTQQRQPMVCLRCGALRFRRARIGTKGVVDELTAIAGAKVIEVTGEVTGGSRGTESTARVGRGPGIFVGTEALLYRAERADNVIFLDFDQELLAPRYRANEEAMALLCGAARLVGPRDAAGGRVLVQTRMAEHSVLAAATAGQTEAWSVAQASERQARRQPPHACWVLVSGAGAEQFIAAAKQVLAQADDLSVEIGATGDDTWRLVSTDAERLLALLAQVPRPKARTRIEVDPLRV